MGHDIAEAPPGLAWKPSGFVGVAGSMRDLAAQIDRRFLDLALSFGAEQQEFGPLLSVSDLRKIDYFSSFPHLVTFPASATSDGENLRAFARRNASTAEGPLFLPETGAVEAVLAPAACYAVYIGMEGADIVAMPRLITVRGTCFRSERAFEPLIRQPAFSMREIVLLGEAPSAISFLAHARERVVSIATEWGLAPAIEVAADPFFDPARSPKYVHATLFPSKHELLDHDVALSSFNNHRNFFGEAYRISTGGAPVHTACVAFGIERWMSAIVRTHGPHPAAWPVDLRPTSQLQ